MKHMLTCCSSICLVDCRSCLPPACWPLACPARRDGRGLAQLLRELSALSGLRWLRILYAYPSYFDDELVAEIANNPKAGISKGCSKPLQQCQAVIAGASRLLASQRVKATAATTGVQQRQQLLQQ